MGMSTTPVSFTDDRMAIVPDESSPKYVDYIRYSRKLTLRKFAGGRRVSVSKVSGTNEYIFESMDGEFAKGQVAA